MTTSQGFPQSARVLRQREEEILRRWEDEVRSLRGPSAGEPGSAALRNDIPVMIRTLAEGLAPPAPREEIADRSPYEHALQRFAEDLPLTALVEEYRVLRWALFDAMAREAPEELARAWPYVAMHLDRAIEEAVARYSEQRSRWLRESERELEAVLEELPIGVVVVEAASRRIVRINRELARIRAGAEEAKTAADALRGLERQDGTPCPPEETPLWRALEGAEAGAEELRARAPSGELRAVELSARPLRAETGEIRGAVAIVADVTSRMRARAERELFAATLGHDVRSPLSTIRVAAQRLQQVEGSGLVTKLSGGIARSAAKLSDLVSELLDLARSWERGLELSTEPVDLAELARESAADRASSIQIEAPEPVVGAWDRRRLVRIFENLLANAEKHGAPEAEIGLRVRREGEMAVLEVSSGGSLGDVATGALFEPYRRGEESGKGAGLGLYIVKLFAEAHGGRAEARSEGGKTTFRVSLPLGSSGDAGAKSGDERADGAADSGV